MYWCSLVSEKPKRRSAIESMSEKVLRWVEGRTWLGGVGVGEVTNDSRCGRSGRVKNES